MGASVQPVVDPVAAYLQSRGPSGDPVADYLAAQHAANPTSAAAAKLHADYLSGALQQRTATQNASDQADAQGPGYFSRLATHVLNAAQGIPGMEALEAGAGSLGSKFTNNPLTYSQSLSTLRDATGQIGGGTSAIERFIGSLATLPFLPKNPTAAGAVLGGASGLLNADPDQSLAGRGVATAGGAGIGALLGKFTDAGVTAVKGAMTANTSAQLLAKQAERAAGAKVLYDAAMNEGQGKAFPPQLKYYLQEPEIASIVSGLQATTHKGVPAESPEMLDAVYKTLSDQYRTAQKGLEQLDPTKANLGRFRVQHLSNLKGDLLGGMAATDPNAVPPEPPVMPSYQKAVDYFAQMSRQIKAIGKGNDALRNSLSTAIPSARTAQTNTPETFADWLSTMKDANERAAAASGILGGVKAGLQRGSLTTGRRAAFDAPALLRAVNPNASRAANLGLLGITSNQQP